MRERNHVWLSSATWRRALCGILIAGVLLAASFAHGGGPVLEPDPKAPMRFGPDGQMLGRDRFHAGDPLGLDQHGYVYDRIFRDWGHDVVPQGCKIHVGVPIDADGHMILENGGRALANEMLPYLRDKKIPHKIIGNDVHYNEIMRPIHPDGQGGTRTQRGKYITIYPPDYEHATEVMRYLQDYFNGKKLPGVPEISPHDLPIPYTEGMGSYRIGGFTSDVYILPDGTEIISSRTVPVPEGAPRPNIPLPILNPEFHLDPRKGPLPILNPEFQLDPRAVKLPILNPHFQPAHRSWRMTPVAYEWNRATFQRGGVGALRFGAVALPSGIVGGYVDRTVTHSVRQRYGDFAGDAAGISSGYLAAEGVAVPTTMLVYGVGFRTAALATAEAAPVALPAAVAIHYAAELNETTMKHNEMLLHKHMTVGFDPADMPELHERWYEWKGYWRGFALFYGLAD